MPSFQHSPYIPSTSEHFPFREAIPAPIAIRRISQVSSGDTIMTTPLISEGNKYKFVLS